MPGVTEAAIEEARSKMARMGGVFRTREALDSGIQERTLYAMRDMGILERLARGLYRLAELEPLSNPDLAIVGARVPQGVVCLISALAYHGLTTQIPRAVHIAISPKSSKPKLEWPPLKVWWFGGTAFTSGVEQHDIDGVEVAIYCREKTLADCFKYRNKTGLDVAVEALQLYRDEGDINAPLLMRYAGICRVANVMQPYVEALL